MPPELAARPGGDAPAAAPGNPAGRGEMADRAMGELVGPLARQARRHGPGADAAWPALLTTLVFLNHCAPPLWRALEAQRRSAVGGLPAAVSALAGQALAPLGFLPGGAAGIPGNFRPLEDADVAAAADRCAHLGPDEAALFLGMLAAAAHPGVDSSPTPPETSRLMAAIAVADADPGLPVYDPYLRGGELLAAAQAARPGGAGLVMRGDSPRPAIAPFAAMILALAGVQRAAITDRGSPPWQSSARPSWAGAVLLAPPFNSPVGGVAPDVAWPLGPPSPAKSHFAWLQHAMTCLAPGGRAAVLMPVGAGAAEGPAQRVIREQAASQGAVEAVITLPAGLFASSGAGLALWVVRQPAGAPGPVLLADATAMAVRGRGAHDLAPGAAAEIAGLYQQRHRLTPGEQVRLPGGGTAVLAAPDAVRAAGYSLSPARYLPAEAAASQSPGVPDPAQVLAGLAGQVREARQLGERVSAMTVSRPPAPGRPQTGLAELGQVCEIRPGPAQYKTRDAAPGAEVPVVMPRHLRGGWIDAAGASAVSEDTARRAGSRFRIAPGDILMARTGSIGPPAVAGQEHAGWLLSQNLLRLRVTRPEQADPGYLAAFLGLPRVQEWIRAQARGTTVPSLSVQVLGSLPVTLPPLAAQREAAAALGAIASLARAHKAVADGAERALAVLGYGLVDGTLQMTSTGTAAASLAGLSYPGRPSPSPPAAGRAGHAQARQSPPAPRGTLRQ